MADEIGHLPRGPKRIFKAAVWSWQGLRAAWLHESSFRLEVYLLIVLAPLALWLGQTPVERALMIGSLLGDRGGDRTLRRRVPRARRPRQGHGLGCCIRADDERTGVLGPDPAAADLLT